MAVVLLFRPDFFMDRIEPEYRLVPASQVYDVARDVPTDDRVVMVIQGLTIEGDEVKKTVARSARRPGA